MHSETRQTVHSFISSRHYPLRSKILAQNFVPRHNTTPAKCRRRVVPPWILVGLAACANLTALVDRRVGVELALVGATVVAILAKCHHCRLSLVDERQKTTLACETVDWSVVFAYRMGT